MLHRMHQTRHNGALFSKSCSPSRIEGKIVTQAQCHAEDLIGWMAQKLHKAWHFADQNILVLLKNRELVKCVQRAKEKVLVLPTEQRRQHLANVVLHKLQLQSGFL